ncbi:hypothetical protein BKA69DRAFT_1107321 [Paraphysoderma sedebokerense]|nr:hypothetical protein BKA69DRAFT_1107321 [Paraphysoderma sedebokerense]
MSSATTLLPNVPIIPLEMNIEQGHILDTLRAVLHTIIFQRLIQPIEPCERTVEFLSRSGICYTCINDPQIHRLVDEKIDDLWTTFHSRGVSTAQLVIQFCEKKEKKLWFTTKVEDVCFEQWMINVNLVKDGGLTRPFIKRQLISALKVIVHTAIERMNNVPPIGIDPFVMSIFIPSVSNDTWIKRITKDVRTLSLE